VIKHNFRNNNIKEKILNRFPSPPRILMILKLIREEANYPK